MPVHLAESPLTCVAVGSGRSLEEFEAIHRSAKSRATEATAAAASAAAGSAARVWPRLVRSCLVTAPHAWRCWARRVQRSAQSGFLATESGASGAGSSWRARARLARPRSRSTSASRSDGALHSAADAGATASCARSRSAPTASRSRSATPTALQRPRPRARARTSASRPRTRELRQQAIAEPDRRSTRTASSARPARLRHGSPEFPQDFRPVAARRRRARRRASSTQRIVIAAGEHDGIRLQRPGRARRRPRRQGHELTDTARRSRCSPTRERRRRAVDLDGGAVGIVRARQRRRRIARPRPRAEGASVEAGDRIVTAGSRVSATLAVALPAAGSRSATVTCVGQNDTDLYKQIQIPPLVDFGSLDSRDRARPKGERALTRSTWPSRSARSSSSRPSSGHDLRHDRHRSAARPTCCSSPSSRSRSCAARSSAPSPASPAGSSRHRDPRHARRDLAAAHARRLLDRPLRRDDRRAAARTRRSSRSPWSRSSYAVGALVLHYVLGEPRRPRGSRSSTRCSRRRCSEPPAHAPGLRARAAAPRQPRAARAAPGGAGSLASAGTERSPLAGASCRPTRASPSPTG